MLTLAPAATYSYEPFLRLNLSPANYPTMILIKKANENDASLVAELAKTSFIESHGHSAQPGDINSYITKNYNDDSIREELLDSKNIYYIIYYNDEAAGYSKIVLNSPYTHSAIANISKLERFYLLKKFYNLNLGRRLLEFNIDLMKQNSQTGVWLYVWKENPKAINFYTRNGFRIIGSYNFKISESHSNPNHQMLLEF